MNIVNYSALTLNSDYTSLVTKTWYALISLIVILCKVWSK